MALWQVFANVQNGRYIYVCILYAGGYKGYGLGMMVEMLCGIMAGSSYGPNIRSWKSRGKIANLVSMI